MTLEGNKVISDNSVIEMKSRLTKEEEASLVLKEKAACLQDVIHKIESDQTGSLDRIIDFESDAMKDKVKSDQLANTNIALDSKITELESELVADRAASVMLDDRYTSLQKTLEESIAERILVDSQVVDLIPTASLHKTLAKSIVEKIPPDHQIIELTEPVQVNPAKQNFIEKVALEDKTMRDKKQSYDMSAIDSRVVELERKLMAEFLLLVNDKLHTFGKK
jgi:hypothetical protein